MAFRKPLSEKHSIELDELFDYLTETRKRMVGYPCTQSFDYHELFRFMGFAINNVGDPYAGSNFRMNTHEIERETLSIFAELTEAPEGDYWGYINNGGTEGNMYGLYLARELNPTGIVYFSEDTHYSVAKILRLLNIRSIMIKSQDNGEMDYDDLRETIRLHRDTPPIIFANIGTTMKGAVDDLDKIRAILDELAIHQYYIHCDAALSGMILPFVDDPQAFNFSDGIDSISISGHKLIGSPIPCGVVLAKKRHVDRIARSVEYVGVLDTTLTGSRNALSPLILWYAIHRIGKEGFRELVEGCLGMADYAIEAFKKHNIDAWRNKNSITVVFPRPPDSVLKKWQIAPYRDIGHIITLAHVNKDTVNDLINDIIEAEDKQ